MPVLLPCLGVFIPYLFVVHTQGYSFKNLPLPGYLLLGLHFPSCVCKLLVLRIWLPGLIMPLESSKPPSLILIFGTKFLNFWFLDPYNTNTQKTIFIISIMYWPRTIIVPNTTWTLPKWGVWRVRLAHGTVGWSWEVVPRGLPAGRHTLIA